MFDDCEAFEVPEGLEQLIPAPRRAPDGLE
jgi:hypothetical protein